MAQTSKSVDMIDAIIADLPALVIAEEATQVLRCSDRHLRRLIRSGALRAIKHTESGGSRVLIPRAALADYLRERLR